MLKILKIAAAVLFPILIVIAVMAPIGPMPGFHIGSSVAETLTN